MIVDRNSVINNCITFNRNVVLLLVCFAFVLSLMYELFADTLTIFDVMLSL